MNGAGQVLDAPFLIRGGYELESRVVALGNQWLVVWESRSSSSESSIIRAAFVTAAGVPGTPFYFEDTGLGDEPDVAVQGDTALVVWCDNANYNNAKIDGRLLKADGTFASGEIEVVQAAWDQMPAVTGDGSGGWVVSGGTEPPPPPPPSAVASLTLNPASVVGGKGSTATVTLAQPAPAAGAKVLLSSADVNVAAVPASVLVAAGTTSKTFTVTSKPVAAPTTATFAVNTADVSSVSYATIKAVAGGVTKTVRLTVNP